MLSPLFLPSSSQGLLTPKFRKPRAGLEPQTGHCSGLAMAGAVNGPALQSTSTLGRTSLLKAVDFPPCTSIESTLSCSDRRMQSATASGSPSSVKASAAASIDDTFVGPLCLRLRNSEGLCTARESRATRGISGDRTRSSAKACVHVASRMHNTDGAEFGA